MFSITIPTFNNLEYLKLCLKSINNNSKLKHQIIVHVNEGKDCSWYIKSNKNYSYFLLQKNIGLCSAVNLAYKSGNRLYFIFT